MPKRKERSRTKSGRWRKKRSDTGKKRDKKKYFCMNCGTELVEATISRPNYLCCTKCKEGYWVKGGNIERNGIGCYH